MITLIKDTIDDNDVAALRKWLELSGRRLTKGAETVEFEREWSEWLGVDRSIFVNSGSSANFLMFLALRDYLASKNALEHSLTRRYTVVVPAVSWITSVSPALLLNYDVIVCDCDKDDLGLDVKSFERICVEHNPDAVLVVHVLGHPNKMDEITKLCNEYDVVLLEDCCESHGAEYDCKKVGTFGIMSSFSYFFGHHMSTIEGGMVSTNSSQLAQLLLAYRSHGWLRDLDEENKQCVLDGWGISDFDALYTFVVPGMNLRSTDLQAYIGRLQMKKLDRSVNNRNTAYHKLADRIGRTSTWIQCSEDSKVSSFAFGVIAENKDEIVKRLQAANVECRPLICGNIQNHPFWSYYGLKRWHTPNADKVHTQGFYIPCHQELTDAEIDTMCKIFEECDISGK